MWNMALLGLAVAVVLAVATEARSLEKQNLCGGCGLGGGGGYGGGGGLEWAASRDDGGSAERGGRTTTLRMRAEYYNVYIHD